MRDMTTGMRDLSELRRGVLEPCVLALLDERPRFGLELVRDLDQTNGLLTSQGTIYPLLTRLHGNGQVTSRWQETQGERPRRYYTITDAGRRALAEFRTAWAPFRDTVDQILQPKHHQRGPQARRPQENTA
ncbi:MAG: PadR family transcriptional regulator [Pseudonocardiales bacterium]|nr:MAG: PadR family transcriptional regulator [Pseudonocardiales bacterium]